MNNVKRVDFTITRAEVWPWIWVVLSVIWHGEWRVKLGLDRTHQTFVFEPDDGEQP